MRGGIFRRKCVEMRTMPQKLLNMCAIQVLLFVVRFWILRGRRTLETVGGEVESGNVLSLSLLVCVVRVEGDKMFVVHRYQLPVSDDAQ